MGNSDKVCRVYRQDRYRWLRKLTRHWTVNRASPSTRYFRFPVAVFLQSVDELSEFMETWGFAISFATVQPGNKSEYIHVERGCLFKVLTLGTPGTRFSSLAACTKVLPFQFAVFCSQLMIVGIYGNSGLRDFICNLPAWKLIWI